MSVKTLFPSYLYHHRLARAGQLNRALAREIVALEKMDAHGRDWSRSHFAGGYSSYSSLCKLHRTSPNFGELETLLEPHVRRFIKKLQWNLMGRKVEMTTCWSNSMGRGTYHTMHIHPASVLSGVYYVDVARGSSPFKIEDPRLGLLMAAPPRRASAPKTEQNYVLFEAVAGEFLLFESWLRHEVPPHRGRGRRISISFNYEWI